LGRFISVAVLRELAKHGKEIDLEKNSVLTPSAKDLVKELGLTITHGNQVLSASGDKVTPSAPASVHNHEEFDHDLKKKVQKIVEETLKPACSNPRPLHVRGDQVVIQPFDQAPPGQRIGLTDVVTAKEGNLCAGFMTFDHSELPWFLNYDEADYIIEGDFMLKVGDQVFKAKAGDVVYIPKGSQVVFSSPTFCKVFYVTYPANWADFCD
jgi:ethanolamine utilization protein EutQ